MTAEGEGTDDQRLEQLVEIVETNTQVIAQLAQGQKSLTQMMEQLSHAQVGLAEAQVKLTQVVERMEVHVNSTNAAMERMERVVDYLLRRDGAVDASDSSD
ncbi:hypothetical protein DO97_18725 [Neosynechococcus sphagnicola sy1]|uniref:Uncharacterized protein n=1 Tax=Neosynechococcus sphagnicola sy1 TaxID=1497020 RepID=A0A098TMI9_9CYAN|nr:hypothetical protein [Neosynechococcus sphagnicola]KGF73535.1 hypothetical protein DO97_18725 [Neosynechococcus sphagnicola sy1]